MQPSDRNRTVPLVALVTGGLILVPMLIVAGCTSGERADADLKGTAWILTEYSAGGGTPVYPLVTAPVTLIFEDDKELGGTAGCNHYFASYEIHGADITIGQAGSTEMYCGAPGVMDQESAYLSLLAGAQTFAAENDRLSISDGKGNVILRFARNLPSVPQPLTGTTWTLDSFYAGDTVSSVIAGSSLTAVFDGIGNVTGSAGCNSYFAHYQISASSLTLDPPGSTKKYCGEPGIMEQETTFLSLLSRTGSYTVSGDQLTLKDASDRPLLTFRAAASG